MARYNHLEQIPDDAIYWDVKVRGATAIADSLAERREEAKLYRELATLRVDVPLAETLDQLEWKGVRRPGFQELCAELDFGGLLVPEVKRN